MSPLCHDAYHSSPRTTRLYPVIVHISSCFWYCFSTIFAYLVVGKGLKARYTQHLSPLVLKTCHHEYVNEPIVLWLISRSDSDSCVCCCFHFMFFNVNDDKSDIRSPMCNVRTSCVTKSVTHPHLPHYCIHANNIGRLFLITSLIYHSLTPIADCSSVSSIIGQKDMSLYLDLVTEDSTNDFVTRLVSRQDGWGTLHTYMVQSHRVVAI